MKKRFKSLKRKVRAFSNKLKNISLTRWGVIVAIITGVITLAAWLWPNPILVNPTSQSISVAQALGITQPIPEFKLGTIRILVATFDGAEGKGREVSDAIKLDLEKTLATNINSNIEVVGTLRVIKEMEGSDVAIKIGELYHASIVIWGWSDLTTKSVDLGIHFEVIPSSMEFQSTCAASISTSQRRTEKREEFENLTLQTNLTNDFTYATLLTLGLANFEHGSWGFAIDYFNKAFNYMPYGSLSAETQSQKYLFDSDLLYYYRGFAYVVSGQSELALRDFEQIGDQYEGDATFHLVNGLLYSELENYDRALIQFTKAYDNGSFADIKPIALFYRGIAYYNLSQYELANSDLNMALKLDELVILSQVLDTESVDISSQLRSPKLENALTHFLAGFDKEETDPDLAIEEYGKALQISPDFLFARYSRAPLLEDRGDYELQVQDLTYITKSDFYKTPCNYLKLGLGHLILGDFKSSKENLITSKLLATQEISINPDNAYAYSVRGQADIFLLKFPQGLFDFMYARLLSKDDEAKSDANSFIIFALAVNILALLLLIWVCSILLFVSSLVQLVIGVVLLVLSLILKSKLSQKIKPFRLGRK